jgi:hypothetical protein
MKERRKVKIISLISKHHHMAAPCLELGKDVWELLIEIKFKKNTKS